MNDTNPKALNKGIQMSSTGMAMTNIFFIIFCLLCLFPLLLVISISLSDEKDVVKYGFQLIPMHLTTTAYTMIFEFPQKILNAYKVTMLVTTMATLINILFTSMIAYTLSRPTFKFRKGISFYLFFTMLFSGGLVPYYILMTQYLHLTDSIIALIVPNMFSAYYAFMMRTCFQRLPPELIESAKIDGASEFRIYSRIIMPLSTPVIATVGLFVALGCWNDWITSLLFINKPKLYSLQMLLQMMMANIQSVSNDMVNMNARDFLNSRKVPAETLRMAMCIVSIGPILILFPFLQKYFVQGLTVGSVKG